MQITPHIHMLTIPFAVPLPTGPVPRSANVFLVFGETVTLVDSGVAGAEELIFAYLRGMGRRPEEIGTLILTHSHPDHIGAAAAIRAATGCTVAAHRDERGWIEDVALQERERPVPGFRDLVGGPVAVDRLLTDGDLLDVGGGVLLEVLHTPGHSPGSLSLRLAADDAFITGDAVPVPGDLPIFDDFGSAVASLERLRGCGTECLLSSWDEPRRGSRARHAIEDGLAWLERINGTVHFLAGEGAEDSMELCRRTVAELGLPPFAANPLVARAILSCLKGNVRGRRSLN